MKSKLALFAALILLTSYLGASSSAVKLEVLSDGSSDSQADGFGAVVVFANLNGDSYPDMVVSAPGNDSFAKDAGAVYIYYGSASLGPGSLSPAKADVVLTGSLAGSGFGASLANAGDINNDGLDDLLVGAPSYMGDTGAAFLFLGGSLANTTAEHANATILGDWAGTRLGASVSGLGDVNGDNIDDFIVGDPGGAYSGDARVYYGRTASKHQTFYPDLWEVPADKPQPLDFTSGLNSTGNTFGLAGADDGWDWAAQAYGGTDPNVVFNTGSVAADARLHVRVGGGSTGNGGGNNNVPASGAYGIEFTITDEMLGAFQNGSRATLAFDWEIWDENQLDGIFGGMGGNGECAWLKASITNSSGRYYFGSDQDSWVGGANDDSTTANRDPSNELYYYYWGDGTRDFRDRGSYTDDVTRYFTAAGNYYLDMGVKLGDWSRVDEYFHGGFDNISIVISPYTYSDALLISAGTPKFATAVSGAGDVNGDGCDDVLVGGAGEDRAFLYYGSPHFAADFDLKWASITPNAKNASDNTNEPLSDLQTDGDNNWYRVDRGNRLYTDGFGTSGISGNIFYAGLYASFRTSGGYSGNNNIRYAVPPANLASTYLQPWNTQNNKNWLGPSINLVAPGGVRTVRDLGKLQMEFTNNDGGGMADYVEFDNMYIVAGYTAPPNVTFVGPKDSQFGASLASAGDLNGDGYADLAIGAPNTTSGQGAVHVYNGGSSLRSVLNSTDAQADLTGTLAGDRFGSSIASGLVSLDALTDLVVGAPGASTIYVFNGTGNMSDTPAARANDIVVGENTTSAFGAALSTGDLNGLGYDEVLIGAPKWNGSGKAYIYGNADEKVLLQPLLVTYTPTTDPTISEMENQSFGFNVTNPIVELKVSAMWLVDNVVDPSSGGAFYTYYSNYTSAGVHNVTVLISDGRRSAQHSWTLTVINVNGPPTVTWDPLWDVEIDEGLSVNMSATVYDPDGDVVTFKWFLDGAALSNPVNFFNLSTDYNSAGKFLYCCTIDDGQGHSASHNWSVTVNNVNRAPVIDTRDPQVADVSIDEGTSRGFAITAHDPDSDPLAVMWYVGGRMVAVDTMSYTVDADFKSAGTKEVKAVVSDGELTAVASWALTIRNVNAPPVIDAYSPLTDLKVNEGERASFWVTAHDPDGDQLTVSWLVDGGLNSSGSFSLSFPTTHDSNSLYSIQAVISDGQAQAVHNWTLRVNHAPIITSQFPKENLTFLALGQEQLYLVTPFDQDSDPLVTGWYLDDRYQAGSTGNSEKFVVGPSSAGTYRLKVIVSDGSLTAFHEWTVQVNASTSQPPVPVIDLSPRSPKAGQEVIGTAKNTKTPGKAAILNYTWDFGDGTVGYGMDVAHTYKEAGTYTIKLTVVDADGNRASTTAAIAVSPSKGVTGKSETDWGLPIFALILVLFCILMLVAIWQRSTQKKLEAPPEPEPQRDQEEPEDDIDRAVKSYRPKKPEPGPAKPVLPPKDASGAPVTQRFDDEGNLIPREPPKGQAPKEEP